MPLTLLLILFAALGVVLMMGVPIAFALGGVSVLGLLVLQGPFAVPQLAHLVYSEGTSFLLILVPLFVLMAELISFSGIANELYTAANLWFSRVPGALAVSSIFACAGFASISGSSPATAATMGRIALPEMVNRGYNKPLASGAIAAGGTLGILIPPSVTMVVFAIVTEVSIGKLFIAGILPGIMLAILLASYVVVAAWRNPGLAPRYSEQITWRQRFRALSRVWPVVLLSGVVLLTIYTGIATPTEASGIGATGAMLAALAYRQLTPRRLMEAVLHTVRVSSMLLFIVFGAVAFSYLLSLESIPQTLSSYLSALPVSRWWIMILFQLFVVFLGFFLEAVGIITLTMPVIFPAMMQLGFDPIWFGIIITINIEISLITAPVGLNLYVLKSVAPDGVTLGDIIKGAIPFVFVMLAGMAILMLFPAIALFLPSFMH